MRNFLIFVAFFSISFTIDAQPGDPSGDPDVPITGIEILIGLGGALGARKLIKKRKPTDH